MGEARLRHPRGNESASARKGLEQALGERECKSVAQMRADIAVCGYGGWRMGCIVIRYNGEALDH